MAVAALPTFGPPQYRRARIVVLLLAFLGMVSLVAVWELTLNRPISCERHQGTFSNDFSPDFDITRVNCRLSSIKNSPTIRFWGVSPYIGIKW
jgi:hypothetical protein